MPIRSDIVLFRVEIRSRKSREKKEVLVFSFHSIDSSGCIHTRLIQEIFVRRALKRDNCIYFIYERLKREELTPCASYTIAHY